MWYFQVCFWGAFHFSCSPQPTVIEKKSKDGIDDAAVLKGFHDPNHKNSHLIQRNLRKSMQVSESSWCTLPGCVKKVGRLWHTARSILGKVQKARSRKEEERKGFQIVCFLPRKGSLPVFLYREGDCIVCMYQTEEFLGITPLFDILLTFTYVETSLSLRATWGSGYMNWKLIHCHFVWMPTCPFMCSDEHLKSKVGFTRALSFGNSSAPMINGWQACCETWNCWEGAFVFAQQNCFAMLQYTLILPSRVT